MNREPLGRMRILVVDDDRNHRFLYQLGLKDEFDVHVAEDSDTALDLASRAPPDVLVTDLRMPGSNGIELARQVQTLYPAARRVLVTAWPEADEAKAALADGTLSDILAKPLQLDDLSAYLRRLRT